MPNIDWNLKGVEISACNCDWGCPCQFNALPTHGNCRASTAFEIERGHFGDTKLDGLKFGGLFAWPKAIHEGNGEAQPFIDVSASEAQRMALLTIMSGAETEPGATIFNVFAATLVKMHDPIFLPIEFRVDRTKMSGSFSVPDIVAVKNEPIRNPVTGVEHRVRVTLPQGFEYTEADFVSSATKTAPKAAIALDWAKGHGHLADVHWTGQGPVR